MCLEKVTSTEEQPQTVGYGWKLFERRVDGFYSLFQFSSYQEGIEVEVDDEEWDLSSDEQHYRLGFHIYNSEPPNKIRTQFYFRVGEVVIRKVKYRHIFAEGEDYNYATGTYCEPCVVARFMTILPEETA